MKGLVIVAKQRTGTNFLRSLLGQSTTGWDCSEIFHTETVKNSANFFGWLARDGRPFPAIRSEADVMAMFRDYLDFAEAEHPVPILDIKYNSLWAIAPSWHTVLEQPAVLKVLNQRGYKFVHLTRKNRLDYAMSHLLAAETGIFVTREEVEIDRIFHVEPERLERMIRQYDMERNHIQRFMNRVKKRADLTYETLLDADEAALETALRGLVADTDIEFRALRPAKTKKILKNWRDNVSNAAEIEAKFGAAMAG